MENLPIRAIWPPTAPAHAVSTVTVAAGYLYTGGSDGAIVRWHVDDCLPARAVCMLAGHSCAIRHMAQVPTDAGLAGPGHGGHGLLTVDEAGVCCVWAEPQGLCVRRQRIAELAGPGVVFAATTPQAPPSPFLVATLPPAPYGGTQGGISPTAAPSATPEPTSRTAFPLDQHSRRPYDRTSIGHTPHGRDGPVDLGRVLPAAGGEGEGSVLASGRPPVAVVVDVYKLAVVQLVPMLPLQQLVRMVPGPGPGERGVGQGRGHGSVVGAKGRCGGTPEAAAATLLCVRLCGVQLPGEGEQDQPGAENGGSKLSAAVAVTALGTVHGRLIPRDPFHAPGWDLAAGPTGWASPGHGGHVSMTDAHEPLLAAAASADLRWLLLGAADAWTLLAASWGTSGGGGGAAPGRGIGAVRQCGTLHLSYVPHRRISLMHQRPQPPLLATPGQGYRGSNASGGGAAPASGSPLPRGTAATAGPSPSRAPPPAHPIRAAKHLVVVPTAGGGASSVRPLADHPPPLTRGGPLEASFASWGRGAPPLGPGPGPGPPGLMKEDEQQHGAAQQQQQQQQAKEGEGGTEQDWAEGPWEEAELRVLAWDGSGRQQLVTLCTAATPHSTSAACPQGGGSSGCVVVVGVQELEGLGTKAHVATNHCVHVPCVDTGGGTASGAAAGGPSQGSWVVGVHCLGTSRSGAEDGADGAGGAAAPRTAVLMWPLGLQSGGGQGSPGELQGLQGAGDVVPRVGYLDDAWRGVPLGDKGTWGSGMEGPSRGFMRGNGQDAVVGTCAAGRQGRPSAAQPSSSLAAAGGRTERGMGAGGGQGSSSCSSSAGSVDCSDVEAGAGGVVDDSSSSSGYSSSTSSGEEDDESGGGVSGEGSEVDDVCKGESAVPLSGGDPGKRADKPGQGGSMARSAEGVEAVAEASGGDTGARRRRYRRLLSGGRLLSCLHERWGVGTGAREGAGQGQAVEEQEGEGDRGLAWLQRRQAAGGKAAGATGGRRPASPAVYASSVVLVDGPEDEAVLLQCAQDGAVRYCDLAAYAAAGPAPAGAGAPLEVYGGGASAAGGCEGKRRRLGSCASSCGPGLAPVRCGVLQGHLAPVTLQMEVTFQPPAGSPLAPTSSHPGPSSAPMPPSPAYPLRGTSSAPAPPHASATKPPSSTTSPGHPFALPQPSTGPVRLLLTGAADGSLRAWRTHPSAFGAPLFAVHPHAGAIRRLLLPRGQGLGLGYEGGGSCPAAFRHCVVSAADDGSLALVCLARGAVLRTCRVPPGCMGLPEEVAWCARRSFLAAAGRDFHGTPIAAVFDLQAPGPAAPLDRLVAGAAAVRSVMDACEPSTCCALRTAPMADHVQQQQQQVEVVVRPAPVWAYRGALRTIYCGPRQEVVLAAVDAEALAAATATLAATAPMASRSVPQSPPCVLSPVSAASPATSRAASLDLGPRAAQLHPSSGAGLPPTPPGHRPSATAAGLRNAAADMWARAAASAGVSLAVGSPAAAFVPSPASSRAASLDLGPRVAHIHQQQQGSPPTPPAAGQRLSAAAPTVTSVASSWPGPAATAPNGHGAAPAADAGARTRASSGAIVHEGLPLPRGADGVALAGSREGSGHRGIGATAAAQRGSDSGSVRGGGNGGCNSDSSSLRALASLASLLHAWGAEPGADAAVMAVLQALGLLQVQVAAQAPSPSRGGRRGRRHVRQGTGAAAATAGAVLGTGESSVGTDVVAGSGCGGGSNSGSGGGSGGDPITASTPGRHHDPADGECGADGGMCRCGGNGNDGGDSRRLRGVGPAMVAPTAGNLPHAQHPPRPLHRASPRPAPRCARPCLVQPAVLSSCGAAAMLLPCHPAPLSPSPQPPSAPRPSRHPSSDLSLGASAPHVGDGTTSASWLLHLAVLARTMAAAADLQPPHTAPTPATQPEGSAVQQQPLDRATALAAAAERLTELCTKGARDAWCAATGAPPTRGSAPTLAALPCLGAPPRLGVWARRWLAADPRVGGAARALLQAYTEPRPRAASTPSAAAAAAAAAAEVHAAMNGTAGRAGLSSALAAAAAAPALPAPTELLLPPQAIELLTLYHPAPNTPASTAASHSETRRRSGSGSGSGGRHSVEGGGGGWGAVPSPAQLHGCYPAVVAAAAACLTHPRLVPRELFSATARCLADMTCLPLDVARQPQGHSTLRAAHSSLQGRQGQQQQQVVVPACSAWAAGQHGGWASEGSGSGSSRYSAGGAGTHGGQQQGQGQGDVGMWAEGGTVLLPALASALLAEALGGPQAERWAAELQPWGAFLDRLLRLIHSIPLPSAAPAAPEPSTLSTSPPSLHHTDHPNPHPHLPHPHAYHPRGASLPSSPTLPTQAAPSSTTTYIGPALAPVTGTCPTWQSASPSDLHGPSLIPSYPGDPSPHSHSQSQAALCYTAPCPAAAPSGPGSGTAAVRHAAAVAAARQLGERAAALWAACCALDLTAAVAAMERSGAGGHPPPLHPLLHRALLSLPASPAGRVALLTHAPRLAEALAACLGSPLARGTPEQHVASYALADMARVLPTCVAAHPVSMQVAVGCGLPPPHAAPASASIGGAPRSPPAEPLAHVCVYDMETGAATWRLPLLPPLDALLPLPPGAPPPPPPPPHGLAEDARGHGGGGGGGSAALRALAERVSCLAHAGVCALQFSPQGDQLAVLAVVPPEDQKEEHKQDIGEADTRSASEQHAAQQHATQRAATTNGTNSNGPPSAAPAAGAAGGAAGSCSAHRPLLAGLLVFSLRLPWASRMAGALAGGRRCLVLQPGHAWLLGLGVPPPLTHGSGRAPATHGSGQVASAPGGMGPGPGGARALLPLLSGKAVALRWAGADCIDLYMQQGQGLQGQGQGRAVRVARFQVPSQQ